MRKLNFLAILAIAATLVVGCGSNAAQPRGATINATLTDMKIALERSNVPAGPVTFVVKNSGKVVHELVVIKTDVAQDKLAANADEVGKVNENGNLGETGDMAVGESKTFTATLPAGHYVIICNEVGHYVDGMHIAFTVN